MRFHLGLVLHCAAAQDSLRKPAESHPHEDDATRDCTQPRHSRCVTCPAPSPQRDCLSSQSPEHTPQYVDGPSSRAERPASPGAKGGWDWRGFRCRRAAPKGRGVLWCNYEGLQGCAEQAYRNKERQERSNADADHEERKDPGQLHRAIILDAGPRRSRQLRMPAQEAGASVGGGTPGTCPRPAGFGDQPSG